MSASHSVLLTIGLFALTFLSPGPNLLLVVQASMSSGRRSGIVAGLGVAAGDGIYAALGLFGMAALIAQGGWLFHMVKLVGGAYLIWYGIAMIRDRRSAEVPVESAGAASATSAKRYFLRGLVTDLANAQTVLFFASIFAVTLTAETPAWAKAASWAGIVAVSILWRIFISYAFSAPAVRRGYARARALLEKAIGGALALFGGRLILEGIG